MSKRLPVSILSDLTKIVVAVIAILCVAAVVPSIAGEAYNGAPAKYVILLIGDGMGISQRTLAAEYDGKRLVMDTFPVHGITTTTAANRFITDSAAAGTALSTGAKMNVGLIGLTPGEKRLKTIAEMAAEKGMRVGIVSSVSLDHATPAAFYAHVPSRYLYYDIAVQLAASGMDFFAGGGLKDPTNKKRRSRDFKGDAREIISRAGYKIVNNKADFMKLKPGDGKIVAINARLAYGRALPYAIDMTEDDLTLPELTAKAIEMLDNEKGFFLMVEGGKIDWACHVHDGLSVIVDTLQFDQAVNVAVEFAKKHAGETLVVVTADHECGGLTLGWAGTRYASNFKALGKQNISLMKFAEEFLEPYRKKCKESDCTFDDIKPLITKHFGLAFEGDPSRDPMVLQPYQVKLLENAYRQTVAGDFKKPKDLQTYLLHGGYEPLAIAVTHILNNKAGLGWTSYHHTGTPVMTSAMGVGADLFSGYYDNTDIAKKIMSVMGIEPKVHYGSP